MKKQEIAQLDQALIIHPFTQYGEDPVNQTVISGEGIYIVLEDGQKIIDAVSSWWVNLHGHAHPYINEALKKQLDHIEHVMFAGFTHEPAVNLARRLLGLAGASYQKVFYSDNGSTAVEVALKLTVQYHKNRGENRQVFLAFENSYHGDTFGSMSVSERDIFVKAFAPMLFPVRYFPIPTKENAEVLFTRFEQYIQTEKPAGFIFEPLVQGAGGMRMYKAEYLDILIEICRKNGVLTIADEVMTGFGRTGKYFAIDHLQHKPDLVCLSKGITGGYLPLGATLLTEAIWGEFQSADPAKTFYHGHSFTGNPLSCAAANASLDLLEKPETHAQWEMINQQHRQFASRIKIHPAVEDIRITGTILAVEFKDPQDQYFYLSGLKEQLYRFFMEKQILIRPLGNIIYTIPPYCIREEELALIYAAFTECADTLLENFPGA